MLDLSAAVGGALARRAWQAVGLAALVAAVGALLRRRKGAGR